MKRSRGRNRRSGGGNPNRHYESQGPDVKIRGSAQQILDKYQQYARDAQTSGDRVAAENYLQHAEHYFRIVAAMQPKDKPRDTSGQDNDAGDEEGPETEAQGKSADADADTASEAAKDEAKPAPKRPRTRKKPSDDEDSDDPMRVVDTEANDADAPKPARKRRTYKKKTEETDAAADDNSGVMAIVSRGAPKKSEEPTDETEDTPAE